MLSENLSQKDMRYHPQSYSRKGATNQTMAPNMVFNQTENVNITMTTSPSVNYNSKKAVNKQKGKKYTLPSKKYSYDKKSMKNSSTPHHLMNDSRGGNQSSQDLLSKNSKNHQSLQIYHEGAVNRVKVKSLENQMADESAVSLQKKSSNKKRKQQEFQKLSEKLKFLEKKIENLKHDKKMERNNSKKSLQKMKNICENAQFKLKDDHHESTKRSSSNKINNKNSVKKSLNSCKNTQSPQNLYTSANTKSSTSAASKCLTSSNSSTIFNKTSSSLSGSKRPAEKTGHRFSNQMVKHEIRKKFHKEKKSMRDDLNLEKFAKGNQMKQSLKCHNNFEEGRGKRQLVKKTLKKTYSNKNLVGKGAGVKDQLKRSNAEQLTDSQLLEDEHSYQKKSSALNQYITKVQKNPLSYPPLPNRKNEGNEIKGNSRVPNTKFPGHKETESEHFYYVTNLLQSITQNFPQKHSLANHQQMIEMANREKQMTVYREHLIQSLQTINYLSLSSKKNQGESGTNHKKSKKQISMPHKNNSIESPQSIAKNLVQLPQMEHLQQHMYLQLSDRQLNSSKCAEKFKNMLSKPLTSSERHLTVVLDLDETLIHCNEDLSEPSDVQLDIKFPTGEIITAGVNIRPFLCEFLHELNKIAEIIIFTASHQCYANVVIDYLQELMDSFYNENSVSQKDFMPPPLDLKHRLYRTNCWQTAEGVYIKDLRVLKNRHIDNILLVDNAAYSYFYQLENGIPIIPFHDDSSDQELLFLLKYLQVVAKNTISGTIRDQQSQPQCGDQKMTPKEFNHQYFQLSQYLNFRQNEHNYQDFISKLYHGHQTKWQVPKF